MGTLDSAAYYNAYGPNFETVVSFLPQDQAPLDSISPGLPREWARLPFPKSHIVGWIAAMATAFERSTLWKSIPGYRFAAFGLTNPRTDISPGFAVLAYADPNVSQPPGILLLPVGATTFQVHVRPAFEVR